MPSRPQFVHHPAHAAHPLQDAVDVGPLPFPESFAAGGRLQELGESLDGHERRPQVVGHDGEEFFLPARRVRPFEFRLRRVLSDPLQLQPTPGEGLEGCFGLSLPPGARGPFAQDLGDDLAHFVPQPPPGVVQRGIRPTLRARLTHVPAPSTAREMYHEGGAPESTQVVDKGPRAS